MWWASCAIPFPIPQESFNKHNLLHAPLLTWGIFPTQTHCIVDVTLLFAVTCSHGCIMNSWGDSHPCCCPSTAEWSGCLMCGGRITGCLLVWPGLTWSSWHTRTDLYHWTCSSLCHSRCSLWLCAACLRGTIHLGELEVQNWSISWKSHF